jgi:poly-gamma-glutamate synthesis protein (capsule biosynthesis protein)
VIGGGDTLVYWSLGNLLFDQTAETSSGMLVELRVFPQGTVFARPLPLPHLFDLALP